MSDKALALFAKDKLPAYLRGAELDDTTKALMGSGGVKRISIRGGVFRKIDGGKEVMKNEDRSMNVVIVRSAPSVARTFYAGTYVEGSNTPPSCWSSDGENPDKDVKSPESSACSTCPQNIAGSGQGDSRACRYSQRVAIILDGDLEGDVMQLSLPAQSLFGKDDGNGMPLQQYVRFLAGHQVPVTAVITEMKFDTDSATPKLTFKPVRPLTEEEYELAKEQGESQDAIDAVTFSVFQASTGGDAEDVAAIEGAIKEEADDEEPPKAAKKTTRKRRTKAEIEAEKAALAAAEAEADDAEDEDGDDGEDDDDEDDEEAELLRKLAEAKARKAKRKKEKEQAEPAPTVRKKAKTSDDAPKDAAEILAAWADDDDDDDTDD